MLHMLPTSPHTRDFCKRIRIGGGHLGNIPLCAESAILTWGRVKKSHSAAASLDSHNSHLAYKDFPLSHRVGLGMWMYVCVCSLWLF